LLYLFFLFFPFFNFFFHLLYFFSNFIFSLCSILSVYSWSSSWLPKVPCDKCSKTWTCSDWSPVGFQIFPRHSSVVKDMGVPFSKKKSMKKIGKKNQKFLEKKIVNVTPLSDIANFSFGKNLDIRDKSTMTPFFSRAQTFVQYLTP